MKYMGWSYDQLSVCPAPYIDAIHAYAAEEKAEAEEHERRNNRM